MISVNVHRVKSVTGFVRNHGSFLTVHLESRAEDDTLNGTSAHELVLFIQPEDLDAVRRGLDELLASALAPIPVKGD